MDQEHLILNKVNISIECVGGGGGYVGVYVVALSLVVTQVLQWIILSGTLFVISCTPQQRHR